MKRLLFLLLSGMALLPVGGDAHATPRWTVPDSTTVFEVGLASQYTAWFHGRRTTNGETYDHRGFTAAHRTLPFGSFIKVVHQETGAMVVVRINDRGPFVRSRVLELSGEAARALGMQEGIPASVAIYLLDEADGQREMAAYAARRNPTPPTRPAEPPVSAAGDQPEAAKAVVPKPATPTASAAPATTTPPRSAPASTPAVRPAPAPVSYEKYAVQLASLRDPKAAQDLVGAVAGAWSQTVTVEGQTWYRVYVGIYQDVEQARQKQAMLAQEGRQGFVKRLDAPPPVATTSASTHRHW